MGKAPLHRAFGARLAAARARQNLTRADMARHVDVTAATVGGWEAGRSRPADLILERIAEATGIPADLLRSGGGEWDVAITQAVRVEGVERHKPAVRKREIKPEPPSTVCNPLLILPGTPPCRTVYGCPFDRGRWCLVCKKVVA